VAARVFLYRSCVAPTIAGSVSLMRLPYDARVHPISATRWSRRFARIGVAANDGDPGSFVAMLGSPSSRQH
jgi:hypothetical protein